MTANSQGPYTPLTKHNGEDSIRLLSLAPGTYEDAILITLTAHNVASLRPRTVIVQNLRDRLEPICAQLRKIDDEAQAHNHNAVLKLSQDSVDLFPLFVSEPDSDLWSLSNCTDVARYLLQDFEELLKDPRYGSVESAVAKLEEYMALLDTPVPRFWALSYTWGTEMSKNLVTVNGHQLTITENLDVALRHLRDATESRILWIDALCINQEDIEERNSQIQLMSCIYGAAKQVVIWLGPAADGSDVLLDGLVDGNIPDTKAAVFGYYMYKLMSRPWWLRMWIIQEIVLGSVVTMTCGDRSIPFQTFIQEFFRLYTRFVYHQTHLQTDPAEFLKQTTHFLPTMDLTVPFLNIRDLLPLLQTLSIDQVFSIPADMVRLSWSHCEVLLAPLAKMVEKDSVLRVHVSALQLATARFKATDPRDKIYALVNITTSPSSLRRIIPDYAKSTAAVFAEAMALTLSENFQAAWMYIPLHLCRDCVPDLPSWVPNMAIDFVPKDADEMRELDIAYPDATNWPAHCPMYYLPSVGIMQDVLNHLSTSEVHEELHPHDTTTFSSDCKVLNTVGSFMGKVIGILEIPHDPAIATNPETPVSSLRDFFTAHNVSVQDALSTIFGSPGLPYTPTSMQTIAFEILVNPSVSLEYVLTMPGGWGSIIEAVVGRTLFCTDTGYVGKMAGGVVQGDVLVGLFGIMLPFVLRGGEEEWRMVNVAYIADHQLGVFGGGKERFTIA